jgi:hypothetical protein
MALMDISEPNRSLLSITSTFVRADESIPRRKYTYKGNQNARGCQKYALAINAILDAYSSRIKN